MPYIKPNRRTIYDPAIDTLLGLLEEMTVVSSKIGKQDAQEVCSNMTADVTYIIYRLIVSTYGDLERWYSKMDAIKALDSAKFEFYENFVKPHEADAKYRNGDIVP